MMEENRKQEVNLRTEELRQAKAHQEALITQLVHQDDISRKEKKAQRDEPGKRKDKW